MMDISDTIIAKSDQLNASDLIGGPITVTITGVKRFDSAEQPIAISYEGDNGKPFKPCKSVRRLLVGMWGMNFAYMPELAWRPGYFVALGLVAASIAVPLCCRICSFVKFVISCAMSTSRIRLSAAMRFSW